MHYTVRDPSLRHQVVFFVHESRIHVSCNCLSKDVNAESYDSMGMSDSSLPRARELYNDPKNHRVPFLKEDEAKW